MEEQSIETLMYRLTAIEKQLEEMKGLLTDSALTKKEIDSIHNDILILESRVKACENQIKGLESSKYNKYKSIVDYVIKFLAATLLSYIAIKVGLK